MAEEIAVLISAQWEFLFQPKPSAPKSQDEARKKNTKNKTKQKNTFHIIWREQHI